MEYNSDYPLPVITRDDVRVIERYVKEGKSLPVTNDGVKKALSNAAPQLIDEITKNYATIQTHAKSWEPVQNGMIGVSSILEAFSKDFHEYGDEAVTLVETMSGYKTRKISSLSDDELKSFPTISLDGESQINIPKLEDTIANIKKSILDKKRRSTATLESLKSFKSTLTNTIEPWIGSMIQRSNPDALDAEISRLRIELRKLKDTISSANIGSNTNHSFLDNFLIIPNKDQAKQELNDSLTGAKLIKQREETLNQITSSNTLKGVLQTLFISMGSLYDVVSPAIKTLTQLHSHWEAIITLIDDSSSQFSKNTDYAYLGIFVRKLKVMLNDWHNIEVNSAELRNAFRLDA
jgi:hypothetical protein